MHVELVYVCACIYVYVFVCSFKRSLDVAKRWPAVDRVSSGMVKQFNCTVLDFCNALWRCLVFTEERQSSYESLGFPFSRSASYFVIIMSVMMMISIREYLTTSCKINNPSERFHITQHIGLLGFVSSFLSKVRMYVRMYHLIYNFSLFNNQVARYV